MILGNQLNLFSKSKVMPYANGIKNEFLSGDKANPVGLDVKMNSLIAGLTTVGNLAPNVITSATDFDPNGNVYFCIVVVSYR